MLGGAERCQGTASGREDGLERPVEVAVFQRGELQSVRVLSPRGERRAAAFAAGVTAAVVLLAMSAAALVVSATKLVVHAPTFFVGWAVVTAGVAWVAARR